MNDNNSVDLAAAEERAWDEAEVLAKRPESVLAFLLATVAKALMEGISKEDLKKMVNHTIDTCPMDEKT